MKASFSLSLGLNLKGIGSRTGKPMMPIDFLNRGTHQELSIQLDPMLGFDLGIDGYPPEK
jgi:hypothetical protein